MLALEHMYSMVYYSIVEVYKSELRGGLITIIDACISSTAMAAAALYSIVLMWAAQTWPRPPPNQKPSIFFLKKQVLYLENVSNWFLVFTWSKYM